MIHQERQKPCNLKKRPTIKKKREIPKSRTVGAERSFPSTLTDLIFCICARLAAWWATSRQASKLEPCHLTRMARSRPVFMFTCDMRSKCTSTSLEPILSRSG